MLGVKYTVYRVVFIMFDQYTTCNVHCSAYIRHTCTVHIVQCTLFSLHSAIPDIDSTHKRSHRTGKQCSESTADCAVLPSRHCLESRACDGSYCSGYILCWVVRTIQYLMHCVTLLSTIFWPFPRLFST